MKEYRYILGSASPRRREICQRFGVPFEVRVSETQEIIPENAAPEEIVLALSKQKAEAVLAALEQQESDTATVTVILCADTVVAMNGHVLGKPTDIQNAKNMLMELSGKCHQVYTGVTLLWYEGRKENCASLSFYECTKVYMGAFSETEIEEYIETGEPMDKAGAYGIQGLGGRLIEKIEGDYYNVVGLPLYACYRALKERGLLH